ncbi:MAG: hypothetical protein R3Y28_07585 [Candidatus Gastranaerophilales bacterium]
MQNTITKTFSNNKSFTSPFVKNNNIIFLQNIETKLQEIFDEELNSDKSILINVSQGTIKKLAMFISGYKMRACSIGVAGETASGKSTITLDIIDTIEQFANHYKINNAVARINTDDYYYDRSEMVNEAGSFAEFAKNYDLDVPEALELKLMSKHIKSLLNGETVYLPQYDMSGTAIRKDDVLETNPSKIVISEGLFTLNDDVVEAFDFKIFVDVSVLAQKERFYKRAVERNLGDSSDEVYKNASSKAKIHIHPTASKADIILSGEADRKAYKKFINKILALVEEIHYSNLAINF